uniref:Uncharacterized protein n=1 Tax=Opuntia streptacantha TaxID=393608 RepID=A0A7C8YVS7_OPUST
MEPPTSILVTLNSSPTAKTAHILYILLVYTGTTTIKCFNVAFTVPFSADPSARMLNLRMNHRLTASSQRLLNYAGSLPWPKLADLRIQNATAVEIVVCLHSTGFQAT